MDWESGGKRDTVVGCDKLCVSTLSVGQGLRLKRDSLCVLTSRKSFCDGKAAAKVYVRHHGGVGHKVCHLRHKPWPPETQSLSQHHPPEGMTLAVGF